MRDLRSTVCTRNYIPAAHFQDMIRFVFGLMLNVGPEICNYGPSDFLLDVLHLVVLLLDKMLLLLLMANTDNNQKAILLPRSLYQS